MSLKNGTPTMKDVAREAGVALGTVSKVVNGIPVGEDYKSRVDRAIAKLNYQVNDFAKSLKIAKTLTIALIIPNIYNTFYSSIAESLNMELSKRGYRMLLCTTDRGDEQSIMTMMSQNRADGIIVLSYSTKLDFPEGLPVVSIDRRFFPGYFLREFRQLRRRTDRSGKTVCSGMPQTGFSRHSHGRGNGSDQAPRRLCLLLPAAGYFFRGMFPYRCRRLCAAG
jgi:hypothetical protein